MSTEATAAAVEAVQAAVSEAAIHEAQVTETIVESVIERAEERVEEAQEMAQRITDAALQTEIGRQVTAIREEFYSWRSQIMTELSSFQTAIQTQIQNMQPQLVAVVTPSPTEQSSSIPLASDSLEAMAEQVIPGSVGEVAPVVLATAPQPEPAPRKVRRLI